MTTQNPDDVVISHAMLGPDYLRSVDDYYEEILEDQLDRDNLVIFHNNSLKQMYFNSKSNEVYPFEEENSFFFRIVYQFRIGSFLFYHQGYH